MASAVHPLPVQPWLAHLAREGSGPEREQQHGGLEAATAKRRASPDEHQQADRPAIPADRAQDGSQPAPAPAEPLRTAAEPPRAQDVQQKPSTAGQTAAATSAAREQACARHCPSPVGLVCTW